MRKKKETNLLEELNSLNQVRAINELKARYTDVELLKLGTNRFYMYIFLANLSIILSLLAPTLLSGLFLLIMGMWYMFIASFYMFKIRIRSYS